MASLYRDLINKHPQMSECFFAFSKEQYNKGIKKAKIEDKEIVSAFGGLYGTKEGIEKFLLFNDEIKKEITQKCDPQEVYNYEYANHECGYTGDDSEAIKITVSYFGKEKAKTIKRKNAFIQIEQI